MEMKTMFRLMLVWCLSFASQLYADSAHNPFIGTWELVEGKYRDEKDPDSQWISSKTSHITSMKIINATHFSYTSYSKGKFWGTGTGYYNFSDTDYAETPELVSYPMEKGKVYRFTYSIEGDVWTNTRTEQGRLVEHEVWRRLSKKAKELPKEN